MQNLPTHETSWRLERALLISFVILLSLSGFSRSNPPRIRSSPSSLVVLSLFCFVLIVDPGITALDEFSNKLMGLEGLHDVTLLSFLCSSEGVEVCMDAGWHVSSWAVCVPHMEVNY